MSVPAPIRNVVSELEKGLKDLYGERFRGLLLYGSYARGDEREGSDVDLLLLLEGPVNAAREIMHLSSVKWPLSLESGLTLSVIPVSIEDFEQAGTIFLRTVRREAIPAAA
ncbi:MAG: nucleotidyltransferase domain-containing protein [Acidobacteria bacterium]|nr:nucleotidyltransferase domain-containing protein [Acidobacteriota bacterium]